MRLLVLAPALLSAALTPAIAAAATPIAGRWLTEDGSAIVAVDTCGTTVCGRIARILKRAPNSPSTDQNNPDPALRNRPIDGLAILTGFTDTGKDWRGRIYDPRSGKNYKSIVRREADGSLKVQGCIAFFCQTQRWTAAR